MSPTIWLLLTFPSWLLAILVMGIPTALAVLGAIVTRRRITSWEAVEERAGFAGMLFAAISTVYAIFLAFTVVVAWENLGEAEKDVASEAATLVAIYRDAGGFPSPASDVMRERVRAYGRAVVDSEWDAMAQAEGSPAAQAALNSLWDYILAFEPQGDKQNTVYGEMYGRLNELGEFRQLRLLAADASVPGVFWLCLIGLGILTVGYTYFLGIKEARVELGMVACLTVTICAALLLTMLLDHPFTGDIRAEPDAFIDALKLMGG
jgi:hypothetical protein